MTKKCIKLSFHGYTPEEAVENGRKGIKVWLDSGYVVTGSKLSAYYPEWHDFYPYNHTDHKVAYVLHKDG